MKRICAWCKKELGFCKEPPEPDTAPITHGICCGCIRKTLSSLAKPLGDFLNHFLQPVFVINPEGRIVTGNKAALNLLKKPLEEVEGKLGGDAFGCQHANLPGGCGKTIHCKSCTIRLTVTDTFKTGQSHFQIPAYPDLNDLTGENKIRFLITTEKAGESVLLRIDEVSEETTAN